MQCPNCKVEVGPECMVVERSADEEAVEVNFGCPGCHRDFYAVLQSEDFAEVD